MLDPDIEREGAEWVAGMIGEQFEAFIPAVFCELVFDAERRVREESGDPDMDHAAMADRLMAIFEDNPEIPTGNGGVSAMLVIEVLHMEDQFRAMAGQPRDVRPSPSRGTGH